MEKQPAVKSYFFDQGYKDISRVMKQTWTAALSPVTKEISRVRSIFRSNVVAGVFTLLCDLLVFPLITLIMVLVNSLFSLVFLAAFLVAAVFIYLGYMIAYTVDLIFCLVKQIVSHCPNCQKRFHIPSYKCPRCGVPHSSLRPSQYGILRRRCRCGAILPTTFFNGRQRLEAICPFCSTNIKDGGVHTGMMIPVVGGPSAGKTCFVNMAISEIEKQAARAGLEFKYSPIDGDEYATNRMYMESGALPMKTSDMRLRYYQFYLTPFGEEIKNLVSLCDVAGEAYDHSDELGSQIGYKYANAFIMLIDPLSVTKYKKSISGMIDVSKYGASHLGMDEILSSLIHTLENMHCLTAKNMMKTDVAVVFTKCDIPMLYGEIGFGAVRAYMNGHSGANQYDATNAVCERFLVKYEEENFLNALKSKFKSVQFFTSSALGHVEDGRAFTPSGVAEPVLWLIDKASKSIDLSDRWGRRI